MDYWSDYPPLPILIKRLIDMFTGGGGASGNTFKPSSEDELKQFMGQFGKV